MLNHKAFMKKAGRLLDSKSPGEQAYLFCADFAGFKMINRNYGVGAGNALLSAAEAFLGTIPAIRLYERLHADQFVFLVLSQELPGRQEILAAYTRCVSAFLEQQQARYSLCTLKVSCGISQIEGKHLLEAFDNANMARRIAKGKGSVAAVLFSNPMLEELDSYYKTERESCIALAEKRFAFHLQPKVDLTSGAIIGAEALARRMDREGRVQCQGTFIEVMEKNGSIVDLDYLIFREVCEYMAKRIDAGLPVVRTSVNLSRLHMDNRETAFTLHRIAREYGISPDFLEFELTETIFMKEFSLAGVLIDKLRHCGYRVAVDDFGSGYAGINICQRLNFDIIKLDRVFLTKEEPMRSRNAIIVPGIIDIARKLNMEIICEGVEEQEQCRALVQMGCTAAQGFYFSPPVEPDVFYQMIQDQEAFCKMI